MLEISLRQLETFAAAAEYGSFTRAAERLHLTLSRRWSKRWAPS